MAKKAPASKKSRIDSAWVNAVVAVLESSEYDAPTRLFYTVEAVGEQRDPAHLQAVLDQTTKGKVSRRWLSILAGAGTAEDATAIAELAATAKSSRAVLSTILSTVADQITDTALLARAATNLVEGIPFSPFSIGPGRAAVAATGDAELARTLEARHAFVTRHQAILADLVEGTQEKRLVAASAKLMQLTGEDRDLAALWTIDQGPGRRNARELLVWARSVAVVSLTFSPLLAASALNSDGIYGSEEKALAPLVAAGGDAAIARFGEILAVAIQRTWNEAIEHIAAICPRAFSAGFEAVMTGLDNEYARRKLCSETSHWSTSLTDEQAERYAAKLVALAKSGVEVERDFWSAWFYLYHAGGLAPMAAVLDDPSSTDKMLDAAFDAIQNMPGDAPQLVLVNALWTTKRCLRDLVFSFNTAAAHRQHAHILARLESEPSLDAAWLYMATHIHWAHRSGLAIETLERILAWPPAILDADPDKRACIASIGLGAALDVHRYDLAHRMLAMLGDRKTCTDPTENTPYDTILIKPNKAALLDDLRSGALEATQQKVLGEVATQRASGVPRAADTARLGILSGSTVKRILLADATTHEAWFFDEGGNVHYYDGYGITPNPATYRSFALTKSWHIAFTDTDGFFTDWRIDERVFARNAADFRHEVIRSGAKLLIHYWNTAAELTFRVFTLEFPTETAATRAFAAIAAHPLDGLSVCDPYYLADKKAGGAWKRNYGNTTYRGYTIGNQTVWTEGDATDVPVTHASVDAARAAFDAHEASAIAAGLYPRELALDEKLRPLSETPLLQWIDKRYRDDNATSRWTLLAVSEIRDQLAACQLDLSDLHIEYGPPATDGELAAYDATLSEPMPDALRDAWKTASYATWTLGDNTRRFLSPAEVISRRTQLRDDLRARLATINKKRAAEWEPENLDFLAVTGEGTGLLALDTRQQELDTFVTCDAESLKSRYIASFNWAVANSFNSDFITAIQAAFPAVKKLCVGQPVSELGAKPKKPAAAKAKKK